MAAPGDFERLYGELGIVPGAGLEELTRAYRRRVSQLHPDRLGGNEVATERLQAIIALYNAAVAFHRQHGRLPGSAAPKTATAATESTTPSSPTRQRGRTPFPRWLAAIMVLAALALVFTSCFSPVSEDDNAGDPPSVAATFHDSQPPHVVDEAATTTLTLGMTKAGVLQSQGLPIEKRPDRWGYGPSWIAFDKGKVSDWYSSPLRPLRNATTAPIHQSQTAQARFHY